MVRSLETIENKRKKLGFVCKRCGKCCSHVDHVIVHSDDIKRWKKEHRKELYNKNMISKIDLSGEWYNFGLSKLFRNTNSKRCPFLRKVRNENEYYCKIQDSKPLCCRYYPINKEHAKVFNCEGYN